MSLDQNVLEKALLESKLIDEKSLRIFKEHAKTKEVSLEEVLFESETLRDDILGTEIAKLYDVPFVKLSEITIPENLLRIIPYTLANHKLVIPYESSGGELKIAMNNPHDYELISFIEKKTGLEPVISYSTKKEIKGALKVYNKDVNKKFNILLKGALNEPTKIESLEDAAKILDTIILFAYQNKASDIHIEPHKDFLAIRNRIDGILHTIAELPLQIMELLVTRIKVLANLRTDEHRSAQDGRIKMELENNEITMRVSIIPTYYGEKTVLRILSSSNQELDLKALGYSERNLKVIHESILKTHGMLLMTGPTGSGKTTTLYSILKLLNSPEVNISTIEDPIEYSLEGINQIQVNSKTNLTFAKGLRSLLRQDPDIVMVGEIRDEETADIAVNAALTGHLVLATLHTNDAVTTLPRMQEMGVENFLLSATVKAIIAQRLVRTICDKCKKSYPVDKEELSKLGKKYNYDANFEKIIEELKNKNPKAEFLQNGEEVVFYKGEGCEACNGTGYKGRTCIAEVLEVTDEIREIINKNSTTELLEEKAKEQGMTTMFMDGMLKTLKGETTIEEVLRVMRN